VGGLTFFLSNSSRRLVQFFSKLTVQTRVSFKSFPMSNEEQALKPALSTRMHSPKYFCFFMERLFAGLRFSRSLSELCTTSKTPGNKQSTGLAPGHAFQHREHFFFNQYRLYFF
jgi:hypothetical protein